MIQFIHMYMQLGCSASELIIQVSDHPVAPSSGRKPWLAGLAATGFPSSFKRKYWYCHVVPTVMSPLAKEEICFSASAQYSPTSGRCSFNSWTAASNCSLFSSYGSSMPRSGWWAFRYTAASAMDIGSSYWVILPLYFEATFGSSVTFHDLGAGFTSLLFHISRLAPRACGIP